MNPVFERHAAEPVRAIEGRAFRLAGRLI